MDGRTESLRSPDPLCNYFLFTLIIANRWHKWLLEEAAYGSLAEHQCHLKWGCNTWYCWVDVIGNGTEVLLSSAPHPANVNVGQEQKFRWCGNLSVPHTVYTPCRVYVAYMLSKYYVSHVVEGSHRTFSLLCISRKSKWMEKQTWPRRGGPASWVWRVRAAVAVAVAVTCLCPGLVVNTPLGPTPGPRVTVAQNRWLQSLFIYLFVCLFLNH